MAKKHYVGTAAEVPVGGRKIVTVGNRSIGVFNVGSNYHALLNVCPHTGGNLCEGTVCGTNRPVNAAHGYCYEHHRADEIIRCAWHGWEFDIATGHCLTDPSLRAKNYPVVVESGDLFILT